MIGVKTSWIMFAYKVGKKKIGRDRHENIVHFERYCHRGVLVSLRLCGVVRRTVFLIRYEDASEATRLTVVYTEKSCLLPMGEQLTINRVGDVGGSAKWPQLV